jgi:hypothetical protein
MAHNILATVAKCMYWFRDVLDAATHAFSEPAKGAFSALNAAAPEVTLPRRLKAFTIKAIWEDRTFTAGILLGLVIIFVVRYTRSPWRHLPPSPRRLPIIGNALVLKDKNWLFSRDCKERFGESLIVHLYPGGR